MAFKADEIRQEAQSLLDGARQSRSAYLHMLDGIAKYHKYPLAQQATLSYAPGNFTAVAEAKIWDKIFHVRIKKAADGVALADEKATDGIKTVYDVRETEGWPDGKQPDLLWHFDTERDSGIFRGISDDNASAMDGLLQVCWSVEDLYSNSQKSGDERLLLSASLAYVLMKRLGFDREAEIHAEQTLTDEMIRSVKEVPMQEISDISREILNGIQDYVQKGKGRGQAFPLESAMQRVQEYANAAARQEKGAVEVGASPAPPAPQAATVEPSTVAAEVAKEDMYFYHPESESFWMMKAGEEIRHGIDYESSERISKEEYEAKKLNPVRSWQEISSVEAPATEVASATVGEAAPEEAGASS
ncbi:MAG: hypothetical protein IJ521_11540, partial [Schwartzia sp.]|nr:hypothetical protein [Schwartzia sp. (in: firmicutes)]